MCFFINNREILHVEGKNGPTETIQGRFACPGNTAKICTWWISQKRKKLRGQFPFWGENQSKLLKPKIDLTLSFWAFSTTDDWRLTPRVRSSPMPSVTNLHQHRAHNEFFWLVKVIAYRVRRSLNLWKYSNRTKLTVDFILSDWSCLGCYFRIFFVVVDGNPAIHHYRHMYNYSQSSHPTSTELKQFLFHPKQ